MKYYAIIGQSGCTCDETSNPAMPVGHIEMQGPPTKSGQVAQADGTWRSYEATLAEIAADYTARIQTRLDGFAQTRGYDSALAAASYAASSNATYKAEGQYMVDVRDATWNWCNACLNAVLAGERPAQAWAEFAAELNEAVPLVWPVVGSVGGSGVMIGG